LRFFYKLVHSLIEQQIGIMCSEVITVNLPVGVIVEDPAPGNVVPDVSCVVTVVQLPVMILKKM
jgi:hypothetical protein